MLRVLAIDPGTKTGVTFQGESGELITQLWDVKALPKTKKRLAEPKRIRLQKLWNKLSQLHAQYIFETFAFEGAAGFMRGKAAVESSHKYRAVIELFCCLHAIDCVEIQPQDLKQFALGKKTGEKSEMIRRANELGYKGLEDNEADSYLIYKWYEHTKTF